MSIENTCTAFNLKNRILAPKKKSCVENTALFLLNYSILLVGVVYR